MSGSAVLVGQGPDAGLLWHRGDPFAEQKAFEQGLAVVELGGREVLTVAGADRLEWLNSLSSGRFLGLGAGDSVQALLLGPTGHVQHWVLAVEDGEQLWLAGEPGHTTANAEMPGSRTSTAGSTDHGGPVTSTPLTPQGDTGNVRLGDYLNSMRFRMKVEVLPRPDVVPMWIGEKLRGEAGLPEAVAPDVAAPFGPGMLRLCKLSAPGGEAVGTSANTPRMSEAVVSDLAEKGGRVAGMWAWEAERIASGVPRIGVDTDERTLPNELGLYATELGKGCYTGQETVARVHNLGRPPRRLVRLLLDGSMNRLPGIGAPIQRAGKACGRAGASAMHHEEGPLALALVNRAVPVDAELVVDGIAAAQEVIVDPDIGLHLTPGRELRPH